VLAIALVVVVFRINLYNLALPGGGGVASRHADFPAQAETVHTGAALAAIRTHAAVKPVACAARTIQSLKPILLRLAEGGTLIRSAFRRASVGDGWSLVLQPTSCVAP